jgi:hypothetical protein
MSKYSDTVITTSMVEDLKVKKNVEIECRGALIMHCVAYIVAEPFCRIYAR